MAVRNLSVSEQAAPAQRTTPAAKLIVRTGTAGRKIGQEMGCPLYQSCTNVLSEPQEGNVTSRIKTFHYSVQGFYPCNGKISTIMNRSTAITGKLWLGFSIHLVQHTPNSTSFFSLNL